MLDTTTPAQGIDKAPTGIHGLDELTEGGLPAGRTTLVCGSAGCGKTLLGITFLVNGVAKYDEPGVFMSFEERPGDLVKNVASLGYHLDTLITERKIAIDHVHLEPNEHEETGDYDLEGLFVRLNYAIDAVGAKRVVIDTIENLFGGLSNTGILRAELRRLIDWLKEKGVTCILTGERGDGQLTRHGLEEYVSDCVILLDNRVIDQVATRRMRIVKYRGSAHGANEYPFLIDRHGFSVMPITSVGLDYPAIDSRVSTGVADLDEMLAGKGHFKGSSILVSGMSGAGKSSLAGTFAASVTRTGQRCIYFAFEESEFAIIRNMKSIGLDLQTPRGKGSLLFSCRRPSLFGLETHLAAMHREISEFQPDAVIVDPISSLVGASGENEVHIMLLRMIDFFKTRGITALFTNLTHGNIEEARTEVQVSSLMDAWILLYHREANGEHNRELYVLKSRGMHHSNQVREFKMTSRGIRLEDAYIGPDGVLTGSARVAQAARDEAAKLHRHRELERRRREVERNRLKIEAEIAALQATIEAETGELARIEGEASNWEDMVSQNRAIMARQRGSRHSGALWKTRDE